MISTPEPTPRRFPGLPRRYKVLSLLGEGSQKQIYLADDTELGRRVAISVVDPHGLQRSALDRLHEVLALAQIREHRHIVATYDVIEDAHSVYIVSQYLPGGDLEARLGALPCRVLPIPEALRIGSDVCRALEHAHASGIAHCDLKPGNIFLDEDDTALLGDFGLAEMTTASPISGDQILGTPAYLAPEQIARNERGPSCDLYALGCLLYELTTGRPPFVAASASEVLRLQQVARPTPPVDRNPAIPTALSDLILKLLEKEPLARPTFARDVRAALTGIRSARIGLAEPELIARDPEIAAFARSFAAPAEAFRGSCSSQGDAGIGKSRLLDELRQMAEACGCLVSVRAGVSRRSGSVPPARRRVDAARRDGSRSSKRSARSCCATSCIWIRALHTPGRSRPAKPSTACSPRYSTRSRRSRIHDRWC